MATARKKRSKEPLVAPVGADPAGLTPEQRMEAYLAYRDYLNPVAGLTMRRARELVEAYPQGNFADLMWTFGAPFVGIECADADLLALIECRTSPLLEMDWEPKIVAREGIDEKLAEDQQAFVRELVDGISNLYEAVEHMEMAPFRGFAHCEIIENADGDVTELRVVDQWNVVRDGSRGRWKYNPRALSTDFRALPDTMLIEPEYFLMREVRRPIGRIALVKFIRENLSQKDWDAFIEIYGVPGGVVIGPPNLDPDQRASFRDAAKKIALGGSGSLPHGSEFKPNDGPRGTNPFKEHLEWLSQKLVLAGTGGKLTMLTEAGSGTLAGHAHADTFERICRAEARRISELIQDQVIAPRLEARFPGRDALAYFELSFREEVDSGKVVEEISKLSSAGYRVKPAQVAEKTGYDLEEDEPAEDPEKDPSDPAPARRKPVANRAPGKPTIRAAEQLGVPPDWLSPVETVLARLEQLAQGSGPLAADAVIAALEEARDQVPELFADMNVADFSDVLEAALGGAALEGVREAARKLTTTP